MLLRPAAERSMSEQQQPDMLYRPSANQTYENVLKLRCKYYQIADCMAHHKCNYHIIFRACYNQ